MAAGQAVSEFGLQSAGVWRRHLSRAANPMPNTSLNASTWLNYHRVEVEACANWRSIVQPHADGKQTEETQIEIDANEKSRSKNRIDAERGNAGTLLLRSIRARHPSITSNQFNSFLYQNPNLEWNISKYLCWNSTPPHSNQLINQLNDRIQTTTDGIQSWTCTDNTRNNRMRNYHKRKKKKQTTAVIIINGNQSTGQKQTKTAQSGSEKKANAKMQRIKGTRLTTGRFDVVDGVSIQLEHFRWIRFLLFVAAHGESVLRYLNQHVVPLLPLFPHAFTPRVQMPAIFIHWLVAFRFA